METLAVLLLLATKEKIYLNEDIDKYFIDSIKPHLPHSRLNRSKDKIKL